MTTNGWNVYSAKSVGDGVFQQFKVQVGGFESLYHFAVRKTKLINLVFRYRKYIFVPIEENDVIGIVCLPLSFKILLLFASSLKMLLLLLWVLLLEGVMPSTLALPLSPLTFLLSVQASKQANERTNKRYCTKFIHGPARRSGGDQNSFELCILSARFKIFVPPSIESFPIHLDTKLRLAFSLCPASFAHSLATAIATHKIANAQKLFLSLLIHDRMKRWLVFAQKCSHVENWERNIKDVNWSGRKRLT